MLDQFFKKPILADRLRGSPLAPHLDSFAASLRDDSYRDSTTRSKLLLLFAFGQWLSRNKFGIAALEEKLVGAFIDDQQRAGRSVRGHAKTACQFLEHLRKHDVVPPLRLACDDSPLVHLLGQYEKHLLMERGLTTATVINYLPFIRSFLTQRFGEGPLFLQDLVSSDSSRFILRYADSMSIGRAKLMVTALRSFFRFLLQHGQIGVDLAASVPTVADWRQSTVPKYIPAEEIERLLASTDLGTSTGRRNFAVLLLLARLGLRAGEVVALELKDIDWRQGVIMIRGKGLLHDRLPLVSEVGEALAAYLHADRPKSPTRRVFICMQAPYRGFAGPSTVTSIVRRALEKAGLHPPIKGAHLLRHSLATGMLNHGASMAEVGELLRHRASDTTEIYAKVNLPGLRSLAQPWPSVGGGQ